MDLDKTWNISEGQWCTLTKLWKLPRGFCLRVPKCVFFSVMQPKWPFAPISTIFETEDVNQWVHAYTGEKFLNFCTGRFQVPKTATRGNFEGVLVIVVQLKWHNFGWWELSRGKSSSQGCSFCTRVLLEMYSLGAMSPPRSQFWWSVPSTSCLPFMVQLHSQGDSTHSLSLCHQIHCNPSSCTRLGSCFHWLPAMFEFTMPAFYKVIWWGIITISP